jgi:hypothetical protein
LCYFARMQSSVAKQLHALLAESDVTSTQIEEATDIHHVSVRRFRSRGRDLDTLNLGDAAKLAKALGAELVLKPGRKR